MLSLSSRDGTWVECTSDFTRCLSCDTVATHVDAFTGKCPSCQAHGTHREVPAEEVLSALRERNALRAEVERLKAAPVVGGVPKLTDEESARMKAVALSCGRHDANGELLCGSCKHSWREVNLEDCDEGCSVGRVDLFFHGEPWQDCPDFASPLSSIKPGEVVVAIPDPTGIVVDLPERYRERGIELVRNAIQWAREHARIVPRAQATNSEGGAE